MANYVVAITGASGAIYAVRLIEVLLSIGQKVHLTISPAATEVLSTELGLKVDLEKFSPAQLLPDVRKLAGDSAIGSLRPAEDSGFDTSSVFSDVDRSPGKLTYHHYQDFAAGIASGSFLTAGMVICPCSMGTLAAIASGQSSNLIHRAADVHLKERRKLIVVPRETPLGLIQLDNMRRLTEAGGIVLPAMPAFYQNPVTIHDLIDFVVGRICDQFGLRLDLFKRWGAEKK
jgi:4-hydroxy-3-polyprenylbenzoate decarboxylase